MSIIILVVVRILCQIIGMFDNVVTRFAILSRTFYGCGICNRQGFPTVPTVPRKNNDSTGGFILNNPGFIFVTIGSTLEYIKEYRTFCEQVLKLFLCQQ